jgi:hypothetical protein
MPSELKPSRRQIVFNWMMGEDLHKCDGWWGTSDQVEHVDELLVALSMTDWQVITPENLPKVGDEVLYFLDEGVPHPRIPHVYELLAEWGTGHDTGKKRWFRPINAPPEPSGVQGKENAS